MSESEVGESAQVEAGLGGGSVLFALLAILVALAGLQAVRRRAAPADAAPAAAAEQERLAPRTAFDEAGIARAVAGLGGVPPETVVALRRRGLSWAMVGERLGLRLAVDPAGTSLRVALAPKDAARPVRRAARPQRPRHSSPG